MAKPPIHKARQIQVKDLIAKQVDEAEYPKPDWWREHIHGRSALEERVRLRAQGAINRPKYGPRCGFKDWQAWRALH